MFRRGNNPLNPTGIDVSSEPTKLYPKMVLPVPGPLTEGEKKSAAQFVSLKQAIRDGPLYTGSNTSKERVVVEIEQSINDGIKRYTDRYARKVKIGRSVDEHPYVVKFFPTELHGVMGITKSKKKKLNISKFKDELMQTETGDEGSLDKNSLLAKRLDEAEEEAANADDDVDEDDEEDDDFDEADDDDNDYNAEQYYDNGEDDDDGGQSDNGEAEF
ncbi:hypothetical protein TRICI_001459 [Trichomonascus ciferrii]|uniref:DNA-directed RNA polymerase III subunit n=1 Tax=Trichomonascus ciferrii TaxID=44093 RepID=A0A642VCL0_9ASCO|nr:hypothetical protein TRICI_001459 [Trichomonascus ciferrii]